MPTIEVDERRGPGLAAALTGLRGGEIAVVDSLGTWFGGLLLGLEDRADREPLAIAEQLSAEGKKLRAALESMEADAVVIAEEAGWGVVPPTPLGRIFRDELGRMTAALAGVAARTFLVVAGYAVDLRAVGLPVSDPGT
jgi:adenosylcobinamide kinase/adenosylcobinamide-phosphate guanylyltransferase